MRDMNDVRVVKAHLNIYISKKNGIYKQAIFNFFFFFLQTFTIILQSEYHFLRYNISILELSSVHSSCKHFLSI